ncbi:MAG: peptide-methionine (S)-S-oxide reductase MsrA [Leptospiraceae bacterium]
MEPGEVSKTSLEATTRSRNGIRKNRATSRLGALLVVSSLLFSCGDANQARAESGSTKAFDLENTEYSVAIFAGGCFWCMEGPFEKVPGVKEVYSGYTGGEKQGPSYKEVASGSTKHIESVIVLYDPEEITYSELLKIFWRNINPMQDNGQFYDIGEQYRTVIFYQTPEEKSLAESSKQELAQSGRFEKPIVTRILPFSGKFWLAEDYHQDYYKKNPVHYNRYRVGSGRDGFLKDYWKESH